MEQSLVTLLLVVVTVIFSYKGFRNERLMQAYQFDVERILVHKEYVRLVSSGFLHTSWWHLIFNMIALFAFGSMLEPMMGVFPFLFIYFLSLVAGNGFALWVHRHHADYTSAGASGAVNGIVYAAIALFPYMGIGLFLLPVSIPAWAFGLAYMLFTIYGIKARWGNSGHAAHLGGAITGMMIAIGFYPEVLSVNYLPILVIALPTLAFIFLVIYKPEVLIMDSFGKKRRYHSIDHEYNHRRVQQQTGLDTLLEKIHKKGMNSLTKKEKETLKHFSKTKK